MVEYINELAIELLGMLVYALGAGTLSILGIGAEQAGVHTLTAGDPTLGLWLVGIGLLALGGSYLLVTDKLLPQIRLLAQGR